MKHPQLLIVILCTLVAAAWAASESQTVYSPTKPSGDVVFFDNFEGDWESRWRKTVDPKYQGRWLVEEVEQPPIGLPGEKGLTIGSVASHHGIAALFPKPLDNKDNELVLQYEVRLQFGLDCGGAYLKFISPHSGFKKDNFTSATPYTIMFGPDKCGSDNKLHFIVRAENPITKAIVEHHLTPRPSIKTDTLTHLYTAHIRQDNTVDIYIDQELVKSANLLKDFEPPINPPAEIPDDKDKKPADWEDKEFVPDPDAVKPDDWDESEPITIPDHTAEKPSGWQDNEKTYIEDPTSVKPEDWQEDLDGEWSAPLVPNPKCTEGNCGEWQRPTLANPKYKGKWSAPKIKNSKYIGVWAPRLIPNPDFYENLHPHNFDKMIGVGIEIWTMTAGIRFNNILVSHDKKVADDFAKRTWGVKHAQEETLQAEIDRVERERFEAENPSGFLATAERYFYIVLEYINENLPLVGISVAVSMLPIIICCCMKPSAPPAPKATIIPLDKGTSSASEEEIEDEIEEEIVVGNEGKVQEIIDNRKQRQAKEKEKEIEKEKEKEKAKEKDTTTKRRKTPRAD